MVSSSNGALAACCCFCGPIKSLRGHRAQWPFESIAAPSQVTMAKEMHQTVRYQMMKREKFCAACCTPDDQEEELVLKRPGRSICLADQFARTPRLITGKTGHFPRYPSTWGTVKHHKGLRLVIPVVVEGQRVEWLCMGEKSQPVG